MLVAKVRLRKPTRVFQFTCGNQGDLKRGENCIVKSDRGTEYGTVVVPPEEMPDEMAERFAMSVVRKADITDESAFLHLLAEEQKAREICVKKINERKLPMKLVDVEYTFDRHKVIFYFTAADRVDFRELVRDLAQELKARIELRHIQVRDEAKIVGGLGVCGRELCCSTFLTEFKPISMRMAKQQNLSLNPTKISGQCGRLLCCLAYENDLYKGKKAELGQKRAIPETPEPDAAADFSWDTPLNEGASATTGGKPVVVEDDVRPMPSVVAKLEAVPVPVLDANEEDLGGDDEGEEGGVDDGTQTGEPGEAQTQSTDPARRNRRRRRRRRGGGGGGGQGGGTPAPRG